MSHLHTRRSLAAKFSIFAALLVFWVAVIILTYALRLGVVGLVQCGLLAFVVVAAAASIARFTILLLVRPLALLQKGLTAVGEGRLEPLQISKSGDEIELLGQSFNRMIEALRASRNEIRSHHELLEERIRQRTEALEEATQRALLANQTKGEFLANMSHELRTPMTGVLGMIDMALDGSLTREQREQLETAQRCAHSLLALLNDILDLSKIEAGMMVLEQIPVDIRLLVADCIQSQEHKARQKGIRLGTQIPPGIPASLIGDPLRLRQILTNLVSNAVKFTEVGSVTIRLMGCPASLAGKYDLEIEVADTGSGIPAEKLPLIFEKFTQADGTISRRYGGTGLGLAITNKLVATHGGQIWVESEVGRGSTFHVTLQLDLSAEPAPAQGRCRIRPVANGLLQPPVADDMSPLFVQLAPGRIEKLRAAVGRADTQELLAEAFRLEGAAAGLAAPGVSKFARVIGEAAAARDFETVCAGLISLEAEMRTLGSGSSSARAAVAGVTG